MSRSPSLVQYTHRAAADTGMQIQDMVRDCNTMETNNDSLFCPISDVALGKLDNTSFIRMRIVAEPACECTQIFCFLKANTDNNLNIHKANLRFWQLRGNIQDAVIPNQ